LLESKTYESLGSFNVWAKDFACTSPNRANAKVYFLIAIGVIWFLFVV